MSETCFVCLRKEKLKNLCINSRTQEHIRFTTGTQIRQSDPVCMDCARSVKVLYKFKKRCMGNYHSVLKLYSIADTAIKPDNGYQVIGPIIPITADDNPITDGSNLLTPKYSTNVSIQSTESGGMFNNGASYLERRASQKLNCPECKRTFVTDAGLTKHKKKHARQNCETVKSENNSGIQCQICNTVSLTSHEADWHHANCLGETLASSRNNNDSARTRSSSVLSQASSSGTVGSKRKRKGSRWTHRKKSKYGPAPGRNPRGGRKCKSDVDRNVDAHANNTPTNDIDSSDSSSVMSFSSNISASSIFTHISGVTLKDGALLTNDRPNTRQFAHAVTKFGKRKLAKRFYAQNRIIVLKLARLLKNKRILDNFECTYEGCSYRSRDCDKMNGHYKEIHKSLSLYYCKECRTKYCSDILLQNHAVCHSSGPFFCPMCESAFEFKHEFSEHVHQHQYRKLRCPECDFVFVDSKSRKIHEQLRHSRTGSYIEKAQRLIAKVDEFRKTQYETDDVDSIYTYERDDDGTGLSLTINSVRSLSESRPTTPFSFINSRASSPFDPNGWPEFNDDDLNVNDCALEIDGRAKNIEDPDGANADAQIAEDSSSMYDENSITIEENNIYIDSELLTEKDIVVVNPHEESVDSMDIENNAFTSQYPDDEINVLPSLDGQNIFEDGDS